MYAIPSHTEHGDTVDVPVLSRGPPMGVSCPGVRAAGRKIEHGFACDGTLVVSLVLPGIVLRRLGEDLWFAFPIIGRAVAGFRADVRIGASGTRGTCRVAAAHLRQAAFAAPSRLLRGRRLFCLPSGVAIRQHTAACGPRPEDVAHRTHRRNGIHRVHVPSRICREIKAARCRKFSSLLTVCILGSCRAAPATGRVRETLLGVQGSRANAASNITALTPRQTCHRQLSLP
jgi:hypothetical protein